MLVPQQCGQVWKRLEAVMQFFEWTDVILPIHIPHGTPQRCMWQATKRHMQEMYVPQYTVGIIITCTNQFRYTSSSGRAWHNQGTALQCQTQHAPLILPPNCNRIKINYVNNSSAEASNSTLVTSKGYDLFTFLSPSSILGNSEGLTGSTAIWTVEFQWTKYLSLKWHEETTNVNKVQTSQ